MRRQSVEPNVISYGVAISACEKGAQPEQGLELLREMQRQSVEPDVISYNAAMSACEKGARPEQALELRRERQRQSVEPGVISYNPALGFSRASQLAGGGVESGCWRGFLLRFRSRARYRS